jgi:glycosyltransferase involved in cell wall biosynthesis
MSPDAGDVPVLFTVHDLSFVTNPEWHTNENVELCRTNVEKARAMGATFLAVSESTRRDLVRLLGIPDARVRVVPNSLDDRSFRPATDYELKRVREKYGLPPRFFLFVGSLEPRKNLETLLRAVAEDAGGLSLVVAGGRGWRNDEIRERLAAAGRNVVPIGYVDDVDLPALYAAAIAMVYPSLYEGFGLPLVEAMACGTPVVTTRVSALPETVGDAGVLLDDPLDARALAAALARLADDPAERERLSRAGLARAPLFSLERTTSALVCLYRELLGGAAG